MLKIAVIGSLAALTLFPVLGCRRKASPAPSPTFSNPAALTGEIHRVSSTKFDLSGANYVGRDACVGCHKEQAAKFAGSHHDNAMQPATEATVLADFENASLTHHGVESRMFRQGGNFMIHTEGPAGEMQDFQVQYVFGIEPLQQYMVEMPVDGQAASTKSLPRIQVLRLSWDTQKKAWFYLPPPDVSEKLAPNDPLHWTGAAQRWNTMCAECHSTNYRKGFDVPDAHGFLGSDSERDSEAGAGTAFAKLLDGQVVASVGQYNSTFAEIDVSCESCHGRGSLHVELANRSFPGWGGEHGYGLADLKGSAENQIQSCAPCHSRRNLVAGGFEAGDNFYDHYTNQLLADRIYYPDGQILDEDYVHGSFIQSKMYHKGIRCSDCHDPHSSQLKHDGNAVCTSCHQHSVAKYDSVSHHFHQPGTDGASCVNCHMPATTYMEIDSRRDHSLRIPRPDVSLKIGTPNACTGCHLEKTNVAESKRGGLGLYQDWMLAAAQGDEEVQAEIRRVDQWCDDACEKWYGDTRRREAHYGEAIWAAQNRDPAAKQLVQELLGQSGELAPAVARATALDALWATDPSAAAESARTAIRDPHPLVRSAAANALVGDANAGVAVRLLETALRDPVRSVRIAAARNLLSFAPQQRNPEAAATLRTVLAELAESLELSSDRSGAHVSLGALAEQQQRSQQAIGHYSDAISVEPLLTGPRTNLAALLEANLLRAPVTDRVRKKLTAQIRNLRLEEMQLLGRDLELLPEAASIQYRYGLSLYLNRADVDDALEKSAIHLVKAAELEPGEAQFSQTAAMILQELKQWDGALKWARAGLERSGGAREYQLLLEQIQQAAAADRKAGSGPDSL